MWEYVGVEIIAKNTKILEIVYWEVLDDVKNLTVLLHIISIK